MRKAAQIFVSRTIARNLLLLVALSGAVYVAPGGSAGLLNHNHSSDSKTDAMASTWDFDYCSEGTLFSRWVYMSAWMYRTCRSSTGYPVLNYAEVHGEPGWPGLTGYGRATVTWTGKQLSVITGSAPCVGSSFNSGEIHTPSACEPSVIGYFPDDGWGGGTGCFDAGCGGYGSTGGDYSGGGGDCSYCSGNWIHDAGCASPYDTNYCG